MLKTVATLGGGGGTGTVTSVSVVSANGLAGTVANASTTPAITLSTSITGVLKGNGTAISAAVSGTDYAPATSGTSILYGNGSGGFSNVTVGSGLSFAAGTLSATGGSGTVTSVSVVSANGLAGTVANATTTPAITLSTSVTGLLKGNGTSISAATSGTDYAPATSGSSILYGNGAGGFSNVTVGTGLSFSGGTLSSTSTATISGSGTTNYVPKFTSSTAIGNSVIYDDGTNVGLNTTLISPAASRVGMTIRGNANGAEFNVQSTSATNGTSDGFALVALNTDSYIYNRLNGFMAFGVNNSEGMRLTSTGLGIGTSSPGAKLDVSGSNAGSVLSSRILNTSTSASSDAQQFIYVNGGTAGDAYTTWSVGGVTSWSGGVRNSDSDSWYLSPGSSLGTSPVLVATTAGNLGIGTSSPANTGNYSTLSINGTTGGQIAFMTAGTAKQYIYSTSTDITYYNANGAQVWYGSGGEAMRLTSTGLGIGTSSPGAKLQVATPSSGAGVIFRYTGGTNNPGLYFTTTESTSVCQIDATGSTGTNALAFAVSSTERMRLDSSGNLGLGVTPSAWSGVTAFEVPAYGHVAAANTQLNFSVNAYYNGGYKYKNTGAATFFNANSNSFTWNIAPSGTAGNAISFTQAMTLDSSGNLLVGATSQAFAEKFQMYGNYAVFNNASYTGFIGQGSALGTGTASDFAFRSSNALAFLTGGATERARIDSSGNLLVGTTTSTDGILQAAVGAATTAQFINTAAANYNLKCWNQATSGDNNFILFVTEGSGGSARGSINYNRAGGGVAYNTTSDYRAKDIIGSVQNSGATIDALKVYEGRMKGATQSRPMLIAHEAQAVTPYAVTGEKDAVNENGDPVYQQMDVSSLVPLLLAELQSLRARVAQLESKGV